jgi:putative membrane protein
MMGDWMYGMGWGWIILIVLVVIVLAVLLVPRGGSSGSQPGGGTAYPQSSSGRALEILKERYARGEISKEEYEEMRRDLGS